MRDKKKRLGDNVGISCRLLQLNIKVNENEEKEIKRKEVFKKDSSSTYAQLYAY